MQKDVIRISTVKCHIHVTEYKFISHFKSFREIKNSFTVDYTMTQNIEKENTRLNDIVSFFFFLT